MTGSKPEKGIATLTSQLLESLESDASKQALAQRWPEAFEIRCCPKCHFVLMVGANFIQLLHHGRVIHV